MLLNKFTGVPAGEYSKIRVYYSSVLGHNAGPPPVDTEFHPTAHYHFDVHFVGGNLVIPVTSDPQGGIRFFSVVIDVVGLKYHEAGNSGNVLLRPQVFAKVVGAPRYIVTGEADQVNHTDGTFVIKAINDNISAAYGSETRWFYVDGRFVGPFGSSGAVALQDTALVDVIGTFQGGVLVAEEVDITFPDVREGSGQRLAPAGQHGVHRAVADGQRHGVPDAQPLRRILRQPDVAARPVGRYLHRQQPPGPGSRLFRRSRPTQTKVLLDQHRGHLLPRTVTPGG